MRNTPRRKLLDAASKVTAKIPEPVGIHVVERAVRLTDPDHMRQMLGQPSEVRIAAFSTAQPL
jgi:hypothetical protein